MKCDKLKAYKGDVTIPVYGTIADAEVYLKKDVDAAIAELKARVKFCSDFELAARKDIKEMRGQHQMLKQFGHYKLSPVQGKMITHEVRQYVSYNVVCMIIKHLESENAELKQKLHDAEMRADLAEAANTEYRLDIEKIKAENERLKKELKHSEDELESYFIFEKEIKQKLRATRRALWIARAEWARSSALSYHLIESHPDKDVSATYKRKANKWEKAKDKCRAKAEEYK